LFVALVLNLVIEGFIPFSLSSIKIGPISKERDTRWGYIAMDIHGYNVHPPPWGSDFGIESRLGRNNTGLRSLHAIALVWSTPRPVPSALPFFGLTEEGALRVFLLDRLGRHHKPLDFCQLNARKDKVESGRQPVGSAESP
jgi:hypothetical protein